MSGNAMVLFVMGGGLAWVAISYLGGWVAHQKGRDFGEGFALGVVFGPLGILVEALLPERFHRGPNRD